MSITAKLTHERSFALVHGPKEWGTDRGTPVSTQCVPTNLLWHRIPGCISREDSKCSKRFRPGCRILEMEDVGKSLLVRVSNERRH